MRGDDSLREPHGRGEAELARRRRGVEHAALRVSCPRVAEGGRRDDADGAFAEPVQVGDRRLDARADVEHATRAADRGEQRAHDVVDVDEVARDRPVAVDRRRLACGEPLEEDRDHAALERRRLARAVDVREPQRDVARAEDPVPAFDVHLGRPFREPVRRHGSQGGALACRRLDLAVDRPARRCEHEVRAGRARRLEHVHGSDDVDVGVERGLLHRRGDVGLGGQVEHEVGVRLEGLADVVLEKRRRRVDKLAAAGAEVVEHDHVVAPRDERVDEM